MGKSVQQELAEIRAWEEANPGEKERITAENSKMRESMIAWAKDITAQRRTRRTGSNPKASCTICVGDILLAEAIMNCLEEHKDLWKN